MSNLSSTSHSDRDLRDIAGIIKQYDLISIQGIADTLVLFVKIGTQCDGGLGIREGLAGVLD